MGVDSSNPSFHAPKWNPITHGVLCHFLLWTARNCLLATLKCIFHLSFITFAKADLWNYKCGFKIMSCEVWRSHLEILAYWFSHAHTHWDTLQPYHIVTVMGDCTNCCSAPKQQQQHGLTTTWIHLIPQPVCAEHPIHQAVTLTSCTFLKVERETLSHAELRLNLYSTPSFQRGRHRVKLHLSNDLWFSAQDGRPLLHQDNSDWSKCALRVKSFCY